MWYSSPDCQYCFLVAAVEARNSATGSASQSLSSLSVSSNCDKIILPTKHILHIVLQCLSFTVRCLKVKVVNNIGIMLSIFPARIGKGWLFSFVVSIHRFWLVIQSALLPLCRKISWMLDSVHDTCENRTWMPIICPKSQPEGGPLQTMQASSALEHCVYVKPTVPPS